ncbi:MAG: hypothetical protein JWM52_495 [Candidatus Saccharibacteria bacterium]|nr:hypothetical protein [Candidatus Saccharibacteria bacterium]
MTDAKTTKEVDAPAPVVTPPVVHGTNGLAIGSLVTGIVAFVFGWTAVFGFLAGATAVVLGIIGLKKPGSKGLSIAGIITGGLGALSSIIFTIFFILAIAIGTAGAGTAITEANRSLDAYNKENQSLIDAKKDYKKGETATFGQFEVKVNSVKRDYVPENAYSAADEGKELIVLNVTAKNVGSESKYISSYDFKINEAGVSNASSYVDVTPTFDSGDISAGASITGNIVYEVTKGASDLKLQYELVVNDLKGGEAKTLTYSLAV